MLRYALTGVLVLVLATIQTTVLRSIEIFHIIPNLLFAFVVCYSLCRNDYSALVVGVVCGFLLDVLSGPAIGINTLLCVAISYLCLCLNESLYSNNAFVAMVFVLLFSLPYELLTYLLHFAMWGKGSLGYAFLCKILPASLYNFVITLVLYPLVRFVTGRNENELR